MELLNDKELACRIAEAVSNNKGSAFYVGGYVRDQILNRDNKDIDIEIHGIAPNKLQELLSTFGPCETKGVSFGVYGIKHYDLDISLPRSESSSGRGHRDFEVFVDPYLGVEKASARRDFTINAMMQDVLTGEIIDCHGGQQDLQNKIIRHVDDITFLDDPLRVLRAAQFAARFDFDIAPETIALCRKADLTALPAERIQTELEKALLKAEKPSIFFESLRQMDQLDYWFPELKNLIGVPQAPSHHPEGDVWNHTMLVIDEAAKVKDKVSNPLGFMLSAVYHDIGKPHTTTQDDKGYHSYDHHGAGEKMVPNIPYIKDKGLSKYVANMVGLHMEPHLLLQSSTKITSYCRMFDKSVNPRDLIYLSQCDKLGRGGAPRDYSESRTRLLHYLSLYEERMRHPCVTGQDLIDMGYKPGILFKQAMGMSHNFQLCGTSKEQAFNQILSFMAKETRKQGLPLPEQAVKRKQEREEARQSRER